MWTGIHFGGQDQGHIKIKVNVKVKVKVKIRTHGGMITVTPRKRKEKAKRDLTLAFCIGKFKVEVILTDTKSNDRADISPVYFAMVMFIYLLISSIYC